MSRALDMTAGMSARELVEEELIHGALRREQLWRMIGLGGAGFGVLGCLAAATVALAVIVGLTSFLLLWILCWPSVLPA